MSLQSKNNATTFLQEIIFENTTNTSIFFHLVMNVNNKHIIFSYGIFLIINRNLVFNCVRLGSNEMFLLPFYIIRQQLNHC